jgi:WD40 repeat protein
MSLNEKDEAEAARKFWKLWQKPVPPDLEPFLQSVGPLTPVRLAAVLCVDLRERWKRQQRIPPEDYLKRFPQLRTEHEAALDVVYCEFLLRDENGEAPTAAEYSKRFPDIAAELGRQIEMHRLLQADEHEISIKTVADDASRKLRAMKPPAVRSAASKNWPILPGYEILDRLGRGGMGVVYKAWQENLFRVVAIKMLQADSGDSAQALARFRVEAEAIARLHHANILQVYEVGEHDSRPFLVMEFADAGTLAQKADGNPWPAHDSAQMVETLARAVHYAHQRGVVHRDLTPGNVLLFADGTPKLSDFGLAKLLVGGSSLTQTGAIVGTPSYMSPEQASGTSRDVGPTVDVYALGTILYELLTGRPPFMAATPLETLALVAHADPVAPRQLQPSVPRDLETICVKCLRKEPGRRYASAADLADDLKRFLNNEPILARPAGWVERTWRWGWRHPGRASALIMLLVTVIGAVGSAVVLHLSLKESEHAKHDALHKLYDSTVNEARAKRLSGWVGQRYLSLALLDKARTLAEQLHLHAHEVDLRNEVIACLALPDLEPIQEWDGYPPATYGIDFDPSLTLYARGDMTGATTVRRMKDDEPTASFPGEGKPVQLRFSPDARFLALSSEGSLRLWELDTKKSFDFPAARNCFSFGMQGKQLAYLHGDEATISVQDLNTREEIHRSALGDPIKKTITSLAFHPELQVLALAVDKEALLYDLKSKQVIATVPHPDKVCCLAWAHNGRVLATGCEDKFIRVFAVEEARLQGVRQFSQFLGHGTLGMELQLNRDGTILASTNWARNLRLWDTRGSQALLKPLAEGGYFRFAAGEDKLACTSPGGKVRVYRTIPGREFRRLPAFKHYPQSTARAVVFHPGGHLLFAAGADGLVSIDVDRDEAQTLPLESWTIPIAFDSNGALITESAKGFWSWPAVLDPHRIRLGPPTNLAPPLTGIRMKEQRTAVGPGSMAIPDRDGALLVRLNEPAAKPVVLKQKDVRYCAISPNGKWVATGTQDAPGEPGAVIWDAKTGNRIRDIPALPRICEVGFSPDSRLLITTGGGCRVWETDSWAPGSVFGGSAFAFDPNGKLLAVEGAQGQVRLLDPETGREFARLTAPGELHSLPVCFNKVGSLLVVYGTESQGLHAWDLRAVRDKLRSIDLDWELPPLPAALDGPRQVKMEYLSTKQQ